MSDFSRGWPGPQSTSSSDHRSWKIFYLVIRKPASETPWTQKLWIYDLRTNKHFTLKTNQLGYKDLEDFIACFNPKNRHERRESERFKAFDYKDLIQRDKANLDIFWLKDESLEDTENLPAPEVLATEIAENLESALEQFNSIIDELKTDKDTQD